MIVTMSESRWVLFGLLASNTIYNHNHLCLYTVPVYDACVNHVVWG